MNDDAAGTRVFGDDSTTPDPYNSPGPYNTPDPYNAPGLPPSVPPQDPAPWMRPPPSSPGETATSLSPEPWDEPQVWQPPPPRKRRRRALPYVLFLAGWAVLVAVAVAIVLWPRGDDGGTAAPPASSVASPQANESTPQDPASDTPSPSPSDEDAATEEATEVDGLLSEMASTRSELGGVVTGGCQPSALERIRDQRQEQLGRARSLDVGALEQGNELKDALVRALQASVESNQRYLDVAPGCPSDSAVADVNSRASEAKAEFMRYWRPIAEREGMDPRSADTI